MHFNNIFSLGIIFNNITLLRLRRLYIANWFNKEINVRITKVQPLMIANYGPFPQSPLALHPPQNSMILYFSNILDVPLSANQTKLLKMTKQLFLSSKKLNQRDRSRPLPPYLSCIKNDMLVNREAAKKYFLNGRYLGIRT